MGEQKRDSSDTGTLISIIMPVWDNAYKTLDTAVNSILAQWFKNGDPPTMEIVFVDDNSRDRATKRKIKSWVRRLSNGQELSHISAKLVTHLQNKGVACARNSGICNSSGKYICYLDSDDVYYPCRMDDAMFSIMLGAEVISQDYDLETYNDDGVIESIERHVSNHIIGLMHLRSFGEIFTPNLVESLTAIALGPLLKNKKLGTIPGKSCGKVVSKPTGQTRTQRMPDSGLGITL